MPFAGINLLNRLVCIFAPFQFRELERVDTRATKVDMACGRCLDSCREPSNMVAQPPVGKQPVYEAHSKIIAFEWSAFRGVSCRLDAFFERLRVSDCADIPYIQGRATTYAKQSCAFLVSCYDEIDIATQRPSLQTVNRILKFSRRDEGPDVAKGDVGRIRIARKRHGKSVAKRHDLKAPGYGVRFRSVDVIYLRVCLQQDFLVADLSNYDGHSLAKTRRTSSLVRA